MDTKLVIFAGIMCTLMVLYQVNSEPVEDFLPDTNGNTRTILTDMEDFFVNISRLSNVIGAVEMIKFMKLTEK